MYCINRQPFLSAATMAGLFCSFIDCRSPSTNYYKLHSFWPSKKFSTSIAHSFSSSISKINRKPLLCKPASPAIDVISTHEHYDGSLVFRFGDPSEVVENVELEKPVTVDEEIESEGIEESSDVKDLDGDHENEVIVKEAEREVNGSCVTELPDEFDTVELENPVIVDEETESAGIGESNVVKVLDDDHEGEVMFKEAEREVNGSGLNEVPDEFDPVTVVERGKDSSDSVDEVPVPISSIAVEVSSSPEADIQTIENDQEVLNEDLSLENVSVADEISEIENTKVIEELSEKKIDNATTLQTVPFEPENDILQSSTGTAVTIDDSVVSEHPNVDAELHNETIQDSTSYSEEAQSSTDASVDSVEAESQNEISEDGVEIDSSELLLNSSNFQVDVSLSEVAECETSQVPLQSVVTGNGIEIDVANSPQLEAAINSSTETNAHTSETGIGIANEIVKDGSESRMMQFTSVSPQLEAESKLDEEMGNGLVEEFKEDEVTGNDGSENDMIQLTFIPPPAKVQSILYEEADSDSLEVLQDDNRVESPSMAKDAPQDLVLETERIKGDDNVEISQLPEASGSEVTEPEPTESATNSEELVTDFVLSSGAALLPHPSKVLTGGEDAYFVTGQTWLGVADGILQWSLDGTNPGVYAQNLIRNCEKLASDCNGNSISYPLDLLNSSVAETQSSGCSTVLLAQFDGQVLHVANVGDSGFVVLRHGTVYKKSRPMLHAFHFPLQIERDNDPCHLAELYQVDLEEDDVIVIATDGLFDNLYDQEISSIVFKSLAADLKLEEIAELLATKAQEVGGSTFSRSPFADSAQAAGYVGYTGGKLDDVTVIVSVVQRRSSSLTL